MDGTVDVIFEDHIAIVTLNCGQNRLNPTFIKKVHQALDKVESNTNIHALITTGNGKFYSNGIDLEWLNGASENEDVQFITEVLPSLYLRMLTFPMLTIAAINGHAYAGAALLAFSHDYRVMRSDRGWICMNEVHINLGFTEFLAMILRTKLPAGQVFHECVVLGKAYSANEAVKAGMVDFAWEEKELIKNAKDLVKKSIPKGPYDRTSLQNMKTDMFKHLIKAKEEGVLYGLEGKSKL